MELITKEYRKELYNAARMALVPELREDTEYVKHFRDEAVTYLFPTIDSYNQLTIPQVEKVIDYLNTLATGIATNEKMRLAHQRMVAKVMAFGLQFAMYKMDFSGYKLNVDGRIITGESVRSYCQHLFLANKMPFNIRNYIFNNFINRHLNKWLEEGGFKRYVKSENSFYWNSALNSELSYLIQRLEQINNVYEQELTNVQCVTHNVN